MWVLKDRYQCTKCFAWKTPTKQNKTKIFPEPVLQNKARHGVEIGKRPYRLFHWLFIAHFRAYLFVFSVSRKIRRLKSCLQKIYMVAEQQHLRISGCVWPTHTCAQASSSIDIWTAYIGIDYQQCIFQKQHHSFTYCLGSSCVCIN